MRLFLGCSKNLLGNLVRPMSSLGVDEAVLGVLQKLLGNLVRPVSSEGTGC